MNFRPEMVAVQRERAQEALAEAAELHMRARQLEAKAALIARTWGFELCDEHHTTNP